MKQRLLALALISVLAACDGHAPSASSSAPAQSTAASGTQSATANYAQTSADTAGLDPVPVLADPKVGDLYAAKISAFSDAGFGDDDEKTSVVYGLMKVVEVQSNHIIVITEDAGWETPKMAKKDLNGDLSNINWDESERIQIKRADLSRMMLDGRIVETRRLDK